MFPYSRIFLPLSFQSSPVLNVSSPTSTPHPHLSHCRTLLPKTKIASDFSFVRRPRPSKTLAFEACAVPLAGNGAALLCLLQEFIPRSAPGGVGARHGAAVRATDKPYSSWVRPAGLCGGYGVWLRWPWAWHLVGHFSSPSKPRHPPPNTQKVAEIAPLFDSFHQGNRP